jgi:hypothetical protein
VFFSLIQSRLPHYVAPAFPAAALLLAVAWPARVPALARILLAALGALLGAALIAAWWAGPVAARLLAPAYPAAPGVVLPASVAVVGIVALALGAVATVGDGRRALAVLAILTGLMLAAGLHVALPAFSADFVAPPGEILRRHAPAMRPCDALVSFGPYRPSFLFYARRPLAFVDPRDPAPLDRLAARAARVLVLTPRALRDRLPPGLAALPALDTRGGYTLLAPPANAPCPPGALAVGASP